MNIFQIPLSRKFLADSLWSLFGTLTSVLAVLVSVKVITSLVAAHDYGQASLVLGVLALLNNLLVGPLMTVHLRMYFDYLEREMARWYSNVFSLALGTGGLIALFIYVLVAFVYSATGTGIYVELIVPAALMVIAQPYLSATANYLEAHRLQRRLAWLNVSQKVSQTIVLIVLLGVAMPGAYAIVLSQGLAILPLLLIFSVPREQHGLNERPADSWKELIGLRESITSFGWALPLGYLVHWVLSTGDRYLIEHFMTTKDVGVYVMNYGFWSIPYLMLNGWLEILTRPLLYDRAAKNDWQGVKQVLVWRTAFGSIASVVGTLALYLIGESLASIMLGEGYWVGLQLMLCISIAHCFFVVGYSILPIFLAGKRPKTILIATSVAAASNILINIIVIPTYGILGAAFSTLVSYVIWAAVLSIGAYLLMGELACHDTEPGPACPGGDDLQHESQGQLLR